MQNIQKEENKAEKHLEKAKNMLDEVVKEESQGYKAEIQTSTGLKHTKKDKQKNEIIDTYEDEFEDDIEEDLPDDNQILDSNDNMARINPAGGSLGGITVSQSLGVDPSVDSLALEDYDHVEPVERMM